MTRGVRVEGAQQGTRSMIVQDHECLEMFEWREVKSNHGRDFRHHQRIEMFE